MNISIILNTLQLILGVLLIALVLLQQQESGFYADSQNIKYSRRGSEKLIYNLTIIVGVLFIISSLANFAW